VSDFICCAKRLMGFVGASVLAIPRRYSFSQDVKLPISNLNEVRILCYMDVDDKIGNEKFERLSMLYRIEVTQ